MTKFTDSMTKPDESLAIVNDYSRKPNENWFFSVSAKAVKFLLEENRSTRLLAICPQVGAFPRPNVRLMSKKICVNLNLYPGKSGIISFSGKSFFAARLRFLSSSVCVK